MAKAPASSNRLCCWWCSKFYTVGHHKRQPVTDLTYCSEKCRTNDALFRKNVDMSIPKWRKEK